MDIPAEVIIKGTIKAGSVYKFSDDDLDTPIPHYFIVLNHNPIDDHLLILVCASSQLANVKWGNLHNPPSTLVEISPKEYSDFIVDSIVNCNSIFLRPIQLLIKKLQEGKLILKAEMPPSIVKKLCNGVLDSPTIPEAQKRILR